MICPVCNSARWCGRPCINGPGKIGFYERHREPDGSVTSQPVTSHTVTSRIDQSVTSQIVCPECARRRRNHAELMRRLRAKA